MERVGREAMMKTKESLQMMSLLRLIKLNHYPELESQIILGLSNRTKVEYTEV